MIRTYPSSRPPAASVPKGWLARAPQSCGPVGQDGGTLCHDLYREGDVLQHFAARPRRGVICKRKERKHGERRTKKTDNPRHIVLGSVSAFPFHPSTLYEEDAEKSKDDRHDARRNDNVNGREVIMSHQLLFQESIDQEHEIHGHCDKDHPQRRGKCLQCLNATRRQRNQ